MTVMREQAQARLAELKREYQLGEGQLGELARREASLRELLQRIAGAIQVLEELLAAEAGQLPHEAAGQPPDEAAGPAPEAGLARATAEENGSRSESAVLTVP